MDDLNKEQLNNDLYATIRNTIVEVSNLKITWAAFGDRNYFSDETLNNAFKASKDYDLVNNTVHPYVEHYFDNNIGGVDFSSYESSSTSLNNITTSILLKAIDDGLDKLGSRKKGDTDSYMFMVVMMLAMRQAAIIAFDKSHYCTAMDFYKRLIEALDLTADVCIHEKNKLSFESKKKANTRWSDHNQEKAEKKKQYLEIMDEQNFTTFTETAEYIKQNIETGKKLSYDTIKRWLSEANKGNFS